MEQLGHSKLGRLERLQRLREAGALTGEEFERQKAALFARSRVSWWLGGATALIVIGAGVVLGLSGQTIRPSSGQPSPASAAKKLPQAIQATPQSTAGRTVRDQSIHDQMIAAFRTAFGVDPPAKVTTNQVTRVFRPKRLLWLGNRAVLFSEGTNVLGCHACTGALAIHYLAAAGRGFIVSGAWPDLVQGSGWGSPPQWQISTKLTSYPAVLDEGGFTAQGCTSGGLIITELRPERPISSALIRTTMSNDSGFGDPDQIDGHIANVQKDRSFDVVYTGTRQFTEHWIYRGGQFVLVAGPTKMPQC